MCLVNIVRTVCIVGMMFVYVRAGKQPTKTNKIMKTQIEFTRINNDTNGNPRYVCHFLDLISDKDHQKLVADHGKSLMTTNYAYELAVKKAKTLGGRKYNTKLYSGGIVFQSYNIKQTEYALINIIAS